MRMKVFGKGAEHLGSLPVEFGISSDRVVPSDFEGDADRSRGLPGRRGDLVHFGFDNRFPGGPIGLAGIEAKQLR